jgi:hypothetical protein
MFKRTLKPERVDDWVFVPVPLTGRERLLTLASAIRALFQTKIDIHEEDGTWILDQPYLFIDRLGSFMAEIETLILGYRYRLVDLKDDPEYQLTKLVVTVDDMDEDTRKAFLGEVSKDIESR